MTEVKMASAGSDAKPKPEKLPVTVSKPTPYTFDLGYLMANDPNPLDLPRSTPLNESLKAIARDGTQSLLNQLLTTCPITSSAQNGVLLTLPPPATALPRHKPLPTPKQPTKWELFARKKGIGKYSTTPGAALADKERRKKLVYDEEKGEWVPRWGYKGKNKSDDEWLVEVKEKDWQKEEEAAAKGSSIRGMSRADRKERIRRNERKMRSNERRSRKSGGG
ncbi:ribosome biogenesis protein RRS1 [Aspergillus clavatus NRRL 1]|uniref:Ribosome biogenesis regulatory protein n=1 Tax=Aspergillus clavatus (strain ATCC 1007 / CBS 513.65 / DSM 816 / NCTC 3887 / NRRL 1 / QM 1276 / 107) TaxID=344612 RepID=A1CDD0_ASPCL|nr:ribosome biogenesis protein (Rrs1), putative [Aspergillus clavatus NRRL 1]EAW11857.1 ribosome biogenesis protein (Rrs1), putative [Aspergillus clavatus NRRL 1]